MGAVCACGAVWVFDSATGEQVGPDQAVPSSSPPIWCRLHARRHDALRRQRRRPDRRARPRRAPEAGASGRDHRLDRHVLAGRHPVRRPDRWFRQRHGNRRRRDGKASADPAPGPTVPELVHIAPFRVAFSPNGQEIAIGSAAYDGQPAEIEVFSVVDGSSLRRLPVPGVPFIGEPLAWSPDGRVLAGGVQNRVVRIDAIDWCASRGPCRPRPLTSVNELQYDTDGKLAVGGGPGPREGMGLRRVRPADSHLRNNHGPVPAPQLGDQVEA